MTTTAPATHSPSCAQVSTMRLLAEAPNRAIHCAFAGVDGWIVMVSGDPDRPVHHTISGKPVPRRSADAMAKRGWLDVTSGATTRDSAIFTLTDLGREALAEGLVTWAAALGADDAAAAWSGEMTRLRAAFQQTNDDWSDADACLRATVLATAGQEIPPLDAPLPAPLGEVFQRYVAALHANTITRAAITAHQRLDPTTYGMPAST